MNSNVMEPLGSRDLVAIACTVRLSPSATFAVLTPVGDNPVPPGVYVGSVRVGDVVAPCGVRVQDTAEVWCQPRGPLPRPRVGEDVDLWIAPPSGSAAAA